MIIKMAERCGLFAENKDIAREIREKCLKPTLKTKASIVLDFEGVDSTTQSFIHALISGVIQTHGVSILDRIEFKSCSPAVKSLIVTVINYSME
jgi:hypothetical protein